MMLVGVGGDGDVRPQAGQPVGHGVPGAGLHHVGGDHGHVEPLDPTETAPQRVEVEERLGRVLPVPPPAVDDRALRGLGASAGLLLVVVA